MKLTGKCKEDFFKVHVVKGLVLKCELDLFISANS